MTLKRILPFRWLPASWGLHGSAFAEAEINYLYSGQERELRLAGVRFNDNPSALRRRVLEIAHEYGEIEEYDYFRKLLALDLSGLELEYALIDLDCKYGKISRHEAAVEKLTRRLRAEPGDTTLLLALGMLDIDLSFQQISRNEYDKRVATLREEPWISVINAGFNPKEGIDGVYFEFDWNAQWIEFLRLNGYVGLTDEQIVDDWFADVCRSHVQAEMAVAR